MTNGIVIVDKPAGWTSHDVVAKLRGVFGIKRTGHGGTLDPMATGVLPVFIGRATKAAGLCENAEKEYIAGLRLGIVTDTQDTTGNILRTHDVSITESDLRDVISQFRGEQQQIPPMYSAIKKDGKKLYELARRGVEVERSARSVTIPELEMLEGKDCEYLLRVVCSKGTYIRTLCHDIGETLGCGAVMSSLRRIRAGVFTIEAAFEIADIQAAVSSGEPEKVVRPVDSIFSGYPSAILNETDTRRCKNGAPCSAAGLADDMYRFYGPDNEFLGLGEVRNGNIRVTRGFFEVSRQ